MELAQWKVNAQVFKYKQEYPIYFWEAGAGPTLVLLHGFPTASWDWTKIWDSLQKKFRVIALDFIGFGFSAKPRRYQYSIHDQADLVQALLAYLNIQQHHIFSHDYGVSVAQELLARQADQQSSNIQSIVFLNGGLFPGQHKPRPIQSALMSPFGFLLTPFLSKAMLRKNFNRVFGPNTPPSDFEIDTFYALIDEQKGQYIFHKLIQYMGDRVKHKERWEAVLKTPSIPIRLINGAMDPVSGRHLAEYYLENIQNPDVIILEEIGHYPQTEAPKEVLDHYFDFYQRHF